MYDIGQSSHGAIPYTVLIWFMSILQLHIYRDGLHVVHTFGYFSIAHQVSQARDTHIRLIEEFSMCKCH